MDDGIDTGSLLSTRETEIVADDNFQAVHDKLAVMGADLLLETLPNFLIGAIEPTAQDDTFATYAAKIEDADCVIDFTLSAEKIHDRIRGLSPTPLASVVLNGGGVKIVKTHVIDAETNGGNPGTVISLADGTIAVSCGKGVIGLDVILPAGKKQMTAKDFINGRKVKSGDIFK